MPCQTLPTLYVHVCWQSRALWTLTEEEEPYRNQSVRASGGQTKVAVFTAPNAGEELNCWLLLTYLRYVWLVELRGEHQGGGRRRGNWINPTSVPLPSTLRRLTQSYWDYRRKRQRITRLFSFWCHGDPQKNVERFIQKNQPHCAPPWHAVPSKGQRVLGRLQCQLSLLGHSQGSSCQPGTTSVLSEAVPSWTTISLNVPAGNPALIKRTGAAVLCRAGYLPACLQEDLTLSPPMEAPLCSTDCYLHFSEPQQAS